VRAHFLQRSPAASEGQVYGRQPSHQARKSTGRLQLGLDVGEDLGRELGGAGWVINLGDLALLVDERSDAPVAGRAAVLGRTELHRDFILKVGQQREIKMVVLGKLGVGRDRVVAAADDGDVMGGELGTQALEGPPLGGSSTRTRARVEP